MTNEFIPVATGLILGSILSLSRPSLRLIASAVFVLGACATVLSGEFRASWAFLLIDVPLVAFSAIAAYYGLRRLRKAEYRPTRGPR